ncbi:MAG TPA: polysaccharide biosynthesis/export family protein [Candidatus Saccharimonadales bacterium]|nr:polysaccharide biosynthesis/export family protein [Candidatus Saccharimonadales bacterium]
MSTVSLSALVAPPSSAQTVETSQQINDRIRSLSGSAASRPTPAHDYVIGNGDLLTIQVFDVQELSRDVRVSQTGTIGIPLVPVRLHVNGLTELQAELKIAEVLEANGLVSHPQVSVSVKEKKSKPITVVGAVMHPMVYQADRQVTLLEVLAEAGGIAPDAGDSVIVTRAETDPRDDASLPPEISPQDATPTPVAPADSAPTVPTSQTAAPSAPSSSSDSASSTGAAGAPSAVSAKDTQSTPPALPNTITVNLNQVLETGDTTNNIALMAGDIVTVPHAGIVYALGAVNRPGGFTVSNDRNQLTTLKLLALAGGLDRAAKSARAVIVRKDASGQQHEVEVDLKKVMKFEAEDVRLQPSDVLYVPKSTAKQALLKTAELSAAIGTAIVIYRLIQ